MKKFLELAENFVFSVLKFLKPVLFIGVKVNKIKNGKENSFERKIRFSRIFYYISYE